MNGASSNPLARAWWGWLAGAAMVLAGCAGGIPGAQESVCKDGQFLNLAPSSLGYSLSLSQIVTGQHNGGSHTMRFEVEITPKRVVMVGLSLLGVRMFTLQQDAGGLKVDALNAKGLPIDPCYVLSDMQLTYWPVGVLSRALAPRGLRIKGQGKGARRRVFAADGALLIEIIYPLSPGNSGETVVRHLDLPYRLIIKTLEKRVGP
jgi:hypothetical protein